MFNYFDQNKIEQEFPGAYMIPPMKAWKLPKGKENLRENVFKSGDYFAELKIDGGCYTFEHTLNGNLYMFSRTKSAKNKLLVEKSDRVPHLKQFFKTILPPGTVIALELYIPGGKSKDLITIVGCLPNKAIQRQEQQGYLYAFVHDILVYNNSNIMTLPAIERVNLVYNLLQKERSSYVQIPEIITDNIDSFLANAWQRNLEGIILKKKTGQYYPDKRPAWEWIKFKKEDAYDVICIGYLPPNKEYKGKEINTWQYWEEDIPITKPYAKQWVGSLKLGCWKDGQIFEIGSVASGLTEEILEKIKKDPYAYLNKPLMVRAMEATSDYKLREPKFIQFRDDINIEDCNFDKIFS
jgi:hypothetical protein